ncbi:MAG: efflux RND transporter periplasmic adaptor subunit [Methylomicrobium sp.]
MKRAVLLTLAISGLAVAGYFYAQQPKPIEVEVYTVTEGEVKATVSNTRVGTVKACRRAYLAPATGGQVAALHIQEGDKVKQNQLLLEVWNDDLKAQVQLQEAQIKANRSNAEQICELAAGARREADRLVKLQRSKQFVSEDRVDKAVTQANAQRANCRAARDNIDVSIANLSVAKAAVERTFIRAPFDGVVAEINAELGEFVTPSPPGIPTLPAIDLLDVSCLYVSAPIDEVDAAQIRVGMRACVSLDAFSGERCSGQVSRIAPYVLEKEKQARTVEVEVKLTDPNDLAGLLPGYSADIEVLLARKESALRLPAEAVLGTDRVLLLGAGGVLEERPFEPGLSNWNFTEVLSGLAKGDRVVSSVGQEGIVAGVAVSEKP